MGLFSFIGTNKLRGGIMSIIENLLVNLTRTSVFTLNTKPEHLSQIAADKVWATYPDIFNGKFGQRPQKIVGALVGLCLLIHSIDRDKDHENFITIRVALFAIIDEIEKNIKSYAFTNVDIETVELITPIIVEEKKYFEKTEGALVKEFQELNEKLGLD